MKLRSLLFSAALTAAAALGGALSDVKTVYLLPMSSGLDQQLAVILTTSGLVQVVTDPEKADAIFTDRIGANFEQSLKDLYAKKKADTNSDDYTRPTMQPLTRGKGDVFLVDQKSHLVLWSTFATSKSATAGDMNRLASKIVAQLQKDRKSK